jgi:hypothetical protein
VNRVILLFGLLCMGACQPPAQQAEVKEPEPAPLAAPFLTAQEIRDLLGDTPVLLEPAPMDGAEFFYPDGRYIAEARGAFPEGLYEVKPGQICVRPLQYPPRCRSVFKGPDGEIRLGSSAGSTAHSQAITFKPLSHY